MKLGLFGGGFKPFTTGHFSKLARAIKDNDRVYLFYGLQERKPPKIGKRGKPLKSAQKFRPIGSSGRFYTPELSREIFDIYERAIERELPSVEVESTIGSTPMQRVLETIEEFSENQDMYEKVTIYGAEDTIRDYITRARYFGDMLETGKAQLGAISPESIDDYMDEERLMDIVGRSEESSIEALSPYYPDASREDLERMQRIRGTEVRSIASNEDGIEEAKRFLPPFLNDEEKSKVISLLLGDQLSESLIKEYIIGIIRG